MLKNIQSRLNTGTTFCCILSGSIFIEQGECDIYLEFFTKDLLKRLR